MRGGLELKNELWQLRVMSWLPEEEDRDRLRKDGFGVLRARDRFEFDTEGICRERYFDLQPADMRAAGRLMESWGYDDFRPMNTLPVEGYELGGLLTGLWEAAVEDPEEGVVAQLIQQGGRHASGACWNYDGVQLRLFWVDLLKGRVPYTKPLETVVFNDVLTMLEGGQPTEERALWWLNQGVPGILIRFMRDGVKWLQGRGAQLPDLRRAEGVEEMLARKMLYDRGNLGRMLRDFIEQDITVGVHELGFESLLSKKMPMLDGKWEKRNVSVYFGDWILQPWWVLHKDSDEENYLEPHMIPTRYRAEQWAEGKAPDPRFEFELTEDDRELIRSWVLQHRARFATGRWEFSPGWAFYQIPIQIFWLHGLFESEEWHRREHNGTEMVSAFQTVTEHLSDIPDRRIPNDTPRVNDLDWRIRELIVPEVERMAREFCQSVEMESPLESDSRWLKTFRSWDYVPTGKEEEECSLGMEEIYLASQLRKADVLEVLVIAIQGSRVGKSGPTKKGLEAMKRILRGHFKKTGNRKEKTGTDCWLASQGWDDLDFYEELWNYAKSQPAQSV